MRWTKNEENFLKNNYLTISIKELAKQLNRTISSVENKCFSLGLNGKDKRKFSVNNNFFSNINLLNCYWAGFIAADGNIREKVNNICIGLSYKDNQHLHIFAKDCEYTGTVKIREYKNIKIGNYLPKDVIKTCHIEICGNKKWVEDLKENFNITPRKSLILMPPLNLNIEQSLAFIKGIIDGDGTIRLDKNNRLELSIVGTKEILDWISDIFKLVSPIKYKKHNSKVRHRSDRTQKNHYTFKITGIRAWIICNKILQLNIPGLDRKWNNVEKQTKPRYSNKNLELA